MCRGSGSDFASKSLPRQTFLTDCYRKIGVHMSQLSGYRYDISTDTHVNIDINQVLEGDIQGGTTIILAIWSSAQAPILQIAPMGC